MIKDPRVTLERRGTVSLLRIDNPPVNAVSAAVVEQLGAAVEAFSRDTESTALVIACTGRTFVAGGDIADFDDPGFSAAAFNRVLARIEALDRPVVASLHGWTFGGGLELALACHWRTAQPGTQFALPEVKLGLIPGSLGTQRLPRLVGIGLALDLISTGRSIDAQAALACGLIDGIGDGDPTEQGLAFALAMLGEGKGRPRRLSERPVEMAAVHRGFFDEARARAKRERAGYPAATAVVDAIEASGLAFAEGEAVEARLFEMLRKSRESRALRHLFFAQRQAAKVPSLASSPGKRDIRSIGVVGGGTMGRGIAINFLHAGLPVVIVETSEPAREAAAQGVRSVFEANVAKGRLSSAELERRMALLRVVMDDQDLADRDLVIEAVFEDLALKQALCAKLGRICKPGAIIATNTSTLDVDALARATGRPADVIGMHFFSPAHVMKLLEVVRGAHTAPDVLLTAIQLAQSIRKVPVVSGVCWGFIGNRMLEPYLREAEFLLLEGATPAQVDSAVESLGFAMGPCRMLDLAGIDVGAKVVIEQAKAGRLPADDSYRAVVRRLYELGRNGQKAGRGYYGYEGRKALPDPELEGITRELAMEHGIARREAISMDEMRERLIYPLVNEGARILEEGIAYRASDIDVVWASGYGFPEVLGGPMFHADAIGSRQIVERLAHYERTRGNAHGYWTPSELLRHLAVTGGRFQDQASKS